MGPGWGVGVLFALLALLVQLSAAMAVPQTPVADAFAQALADSICHADGSPTGHSHHRMPDCAVCPVCQSLVQAPAVLLPPGPAVPLSVRVAVAGFAPARATGWLGRKSPPATARGPPATI
jgi:hypothetical protein